MNYKESQLTFQIPLWTTVRYRVIHHTNYILPFKSLFAGEISSKSLGVVRQRELTGGLHSHFLQLISGIVKNTVSRDWKMNNLDNTAYVVSILASLKGQCHVIRESP